MPIGMKRRWYSGLFLLVILLMIAVGALLYGRRTREYRSEEFLMDTLVSIRVYGKNEDNLRSAVMEAFAEMRRIADLTDRFPQRGTVARNLSDVCRINDMAGVKPVRVDKDVYDMLALAGKYHGITEGAFDVTVGPVMDLWGFCGNNPHVPTVADIRRALAFVGEDKLELNGKERSAFLKNTGMSLDLGAVAKGYATEKAVRVLRKHGIGKVLIDAGGNIRVIGNNADGKSWRIGIKDPRRSGDILAVLSLEDSAAVTSGDYYRFFTAGGKRYNHILNPRTGWPAAENMSVTVIAKNAGLADVLSTAFFVLDPEKAMEIVKRLKDVELFIVSSDGRIMMTPRLEDRIEMKPGSKVSYDQSR
jgi:thiamine biosynthesis lipoprotein